jgi:uncharacterized protein YbjT (DUF2867 family)
MTLCSSQLLAAARMHLAGINPEIGDQTYERLHIRGMAATIEAAKRAGVGKIVLLSFLGARPNFGSACHESKWESEEMVRHPGSNTRFSQRA